ncbi:FbpB family small basic protein [Bacillus sp. V59.32b]|nr:FbpB family small basic protein [Bacillus sp. V59.32b]RFU63583.1 FbpB family small basic protein [Bacillus sp. V59.32b]
MKRMKISFSELMQKNKDELLKDKSQLEKIEKRVDEKYAKSLNN